MKNVNKSIIKFVFLLWLGCFFTGNALAACSAPEFSEVAKNCMFCSMFDILYQSAAKVARLSYGLFSSDLGKLVIIFLSVSLALIILKNLASFGSKDSGAMINDIIQKIFVCTVIYIIISRDYYYIMNMTIAPIIADGLSFVDSGTCASATMTGAAGASFVTGAGGEVMSAEIGSMIDCAIRSIEAKIASLFDYGQWAWCLGFNDEKIFWNVLPNPIYLLDGVLLYIGGVFFFIAYPWILADAVLQLGISLALFPFAVAGFAFGGTKKYLPKTFAWILHSVFCFIFMFILIDCIIDYVHSLLGTGLIGVGDHDVLFTDPNRGVAFWGPNMIRLLFILFIGITYMPTIKELAGQFSKGSSLSPGQSLGKAITDKMQSKAMEAGEKVAEKGWNATKDVAGSVKRGISNVGRVSTKSFVDRFGHLDADGNRAFTIGRGFLPQFMQRTFTNEKNIPGAITDADGSTIGNAGERIRMVYDNNGNVIGQADENGNVVRSDGSHAGVLNNNGELVDAQGNVIATSKEEQAIFDANGQMIGFAEQDGTVKDLNGTVTGRLDENGVALDNNGNTLGSVYKKGEVAYDSNGNFMGTVDANGNVIDKDGNTIGIMNAQGEVQEIQQTNPQECDVLYDSAGNAYAYVDGAGQARDFAGNIIGRARQNGEVENLNGSVIGQTGLKQDLALDDSGKVIGIINNNGDVLNRAGTVIGKIDTNGNFMAFGAQVIGHSGGLHYLAYGNDGKPIGFISPDLKDRTVTDFDGNTIGNVKDKQSSVLKKEHVSLTGRRHVTISDRYMTVHKVYNRQGALIREDVSFNHDFVKKYLFDAKGIMNTGALRTLLNSPIGQDPKYRQAIMEQIAVMKLKKQGKDVGKYFKSRNVTFDPNHPNKILVEQFDHKGRKTIFSLDVNMETGQTATGFKSEFTPTKPLTSMKRRANIFAKGFMLNNILRGHRGSSGAAFDTWLGTHHEMAVDSATGEQYYISSRKKYLFFGSKIEKSYYRDRTVTHIENNIDNSKNISKIQNKLAHGTPNQSGGMTAKDWRYTYSSYMGSDGQMHYQKQLRKGWAVLNPKNYTRPVLRTVTGAAKVSGAVLSRAPRTAFVVATSPLRLAGKIVKGVTYPIRHPQKSWRGVRHPVTNLFSPALDGIKSWGRGVKNGIQTGFDDVKNHYDGTFQGFDATDYTATSTESIHSHTGEKSGKYKDILTTKNIDGSQTSTNLDTGEVISSRTADAETEIKLYFNNGVVETETKGIQLSDGTIAYEKTKFKYSEAVQNQHDAITHPHDGNQVVEGNGSVSSRLDATRNGGEANPNYLRYGLDDFAGITNIDGINTGDFMLNNVLAEGRRRGTNKLRTNFLNKINNGGSTSSTGGGTGSTGGGTGSTGGGTGSTGGGTDPTGGGTDPDDDNIPDSDTTSPDGLNDEENEDENNENEDENNENEDENNENNENEDESNENEDESNENEDDDFPESSDEISDELNDQISSLINEDSDGLRNIIGLGGDVLGQIDSNGRLIGLALSGCTIDGNNVLDASGQIIGQISQG